MKRSNQRAPRFEALEAKVLLAGDVAVGVVQGNLVVRGDDLDNQVVITAAEQPGSFLVRGLDGTTISGLNPPPDGPANGTDGPVHEVLVEGVRRGATIGLGAGNDVLNIPSAAFRGNVAIRTDGGDDVVVLGAPLAPPGDPPVGNAAGDDTPNDPPRPDHPRLAVGGSLSVQTGEGNDRVRIGHAQVRHSLRVRTGEGNDGVMIGQMPTPDPNPNGDTGAVNVDGGRPDRPHHRPPVTAGSIGVRLGAGNDELEMAGVAVRHSLFAGGGAGDDTMGLHGVSARRLVLRGGHGDGADTIGLGGVHANVASIATGGGNDDVRIVDSAFHSLGVGLGNGDDILAIGDTRAGLALLSGGDGVDTLERLGGNHFRDARIHGFELPPPPTDNPGMVAQSL